MYQLPEARPVTISLRIPQALAAQMKQYTRMHRQSVTELLLDGLHWRLEDGDPRGGGFERPPASGQEETLYDENTAILTPVLAELTALRTLLTRQDMLPPAGDQVLAQRPSVSLPMASDSHPTNGQTAPHRVRDGKVPAPGARDTS